MVNQSSNAQKGFTLVELILVIGLLAISVGVTNDVLISLIRVNSKTQIINEIEQQANFVSLKIEKELRNARNAAVSEEGTRLSFETRDGNEIEYKVYNADTGGIIKRIEGGEEFDLTWDGKEGEGTGVGGVLVTCALSGSDPICFTVTGTSPQIVSISMTFSQSQTTLVASFSGNIDINNSIVIRNTY